MRNKKNSVIGIIITILILIILVVVSNIKIEKWSGVSSVTSYVVLPVQNALTYLKNKVEGNDSFFIDVDNVKKENQELKQKNSDLERKLRELEIVKAENVTLKEYVNLTDKYSQYQTIPGYVIQRDISNYGRTIVINIGSNDGILPGMTVIADKGLVGTVISTTPTTAKIQTIIDTATTVSSAISTTRDSIVVRGSLDSETTLKATHIPTDANVLEGDSVETSGIGGVFPKGIHIGTINKVINTKNITDRYAIIQTAVDFSKLETVLVIK